jgi:hypothetical protein
MKRKLLTIHGKAINCKFYKIVDLQWLNYDALKPEQMYSFTIESVDPNGGANTDYKIVIR